MTRTLFIGLDGFTFHILDDLTADRPGRGAVMPFMARLLKEGYHAPLRSTANPLTPPAWTTLITGRNPGAHGIYDFMRAEDKGHEVFFTLYDFRDIRTETVWSIASRQERSVVALNFPMMAPPPQINGSLIPGFTSARHLRRNSVPEGLFDRLKQIPGFSPKELAWDFERENEIGYEMDDDYLAKWIGYHLPREELWYRTARLLLTEDRPDLMAVMFDGADKIQHQAWQFIDPDLAPEEPDEHFQAMRDLCYDYYRRLDGYIEGLVEAAGPEAQLFMASDHGFTTTTAVVRINRYLADLGHLTYHEVDGSEASQRRANSPFAFLDWAKTVAYCPTPSSNGIRIRVARNPGDPGIRPEAYDSFRERLIRELYELKDPDTGEQVITRVMTREEAFPGGASDQAPDLTLELYDYGFVSIRNLEPAVVKRNVPAGTHHPDGIFIAAGAGIRRSGIRGDSQPIGAMTATFLYSLGLPVPGDLEEAIIGDCFEPDYLTARPVVTGAATMPVVDGQTAQGSAVPEDEKQKILDQLAMLGYLEE